MYAHAHTHSHVHIHIHTLLIKMIENIKTHKLYKQM